MKPAYILIILSLVMTACGTVRRQMTATAAAAQSATPVPATPIPSPTPQPASPPTDVPPTQPAPTDTPATPEDPTATPVFDPEASPRELMATVLAHAGTVRRNDIYCTAAAVPLRMDVYAPKGITGPTPLVIFIHGGGWSEGDKLGGEYLLDTPALLNLGYTVASLNYRMAPEYKFPTMIQDVKCAVRSFRAHAGDYQIDPDKIGVWGTSAGSHLAMLVGATDASAGFEAGDYLDQSSRVQAVLDMYGPADLTVDFSSFFTDLKESVFGGFDLALASPVNYATPDDPPFLILQGDSDHVVPPSQSQRFYDSLTAASVDAQLVIVQGGRHGFDALNISPSRAELSTLIVEFFEAHLK